MKTPKTSKKSKAIVKKVMKQATKQTTKPSTENVDGEFFDKYWEESWTYIKTVVDVVREPILILDKNLRVLAANDPFYQTFHVKPKETEKKLVYDLGNGQWDIPELRKLLEEILPKKTFFKGFEVAHEFAAIGRKVVILNARQIYLKEDTDTKKFPPIILLAMEDATEMIAIAEKLANHTNLFEEKLNSRTQKLEIHIGELQKEINRLKK